MCLSVGMHAVPSGLTVAFHSSPRARALDVTYIFSANSSKTPSIQWLVSPGFESNSRTRQPALAPPGFTPGEPGSGNYKRSQHFASSPPGFMPGERGG